MARRRRQNKTRKNRGFILPLPFTIVLILAVTLAIVYLLLDGRGRVLGERIKKLENQQVALNKRYLYELSKWENMKTPANIEKALRFHNIKMIWPSESQIVRMDYPNMKHGSSRSDAVEVAQLSMKDGRVY